MANEWLSAFLPLGTFEQGVWSPTGASVLFHDPPLVWLITSKRALALDSGKQVSALIGGSGAETVFNMSAALEANGLTWVLHDTLDLAAGLFPLDPAWNVKAFAADTIVRTKDIGPLVPCSSLGLPYGLTGSRRPPPLALDGVISAVDAEAHAIYTTAPLLPANSGAPLLVVTASPTLGGKILLAGILTHDVPLREEQALVPANLVAPSLRVSVAHPIDEVLALLGSEQAIEQKAAVAARSATAD